MGTAQCTNNRKQGLSTQVQKGTERVWFSLLPLKPNPPLNQRKVVTGVLKGGGSKGEGVQERGFKGQEGFCEHEDETTMAWFQTCQNPFLKVVVFGPNTLGTTGWG